MLKTKAGISKGVRWVGGFSLCFCLLVLYLWLFFSLLAFGGWVGLVKRQKTVVKLKVKSKLKVEQKVK